MLVSSAVIDRQFKGEIAATMDKLTTRALQAQVEAAVCIPEVIVLLSTLPTYALNVERR